MVPDWEYEVIGCQSGPACPCKTYVVRKRGTGENFALQVCLCPAVLLLSDRELRKCLCLQKTVVRGKPSEVRANVAHFINDRLKYPHPHLLQFYDGDAEVCASLHSPFF